MKYLRTWLSPVRATLDEWKKDDAGTLGAALAFYAVFSLAPILVIAVAVAGSIFGAQAVRGQIVAQAGTFIGPGPAQEIETLLRNAQAHSAHRGLAAVLGTITFVFGATGVVNQLRHSLNRVWNVTPGPRGRIRGYMLDRVLSLVIVLAISFVLLLSLLLSAALAAFRKWAVHLVPGQLLLSLEAGDFVLSIAVITVLFAVIYKVLPAARIAWRDVWVGAGVTAVLFTIGKYLIALYLGRSSISSVYGAAGSLAVLLAWVYYSSLVFLFGAEFTQVYALRWGTRIDSLWAWRARRGAPPGEEKREAESGS